MKKNLLTLFALAPLLALAGGFQVNLQGNQQAGMGHLGTSFYLGASSTYFNPAMMGQSENKFNLEFGGHAIQSYVAFQNQNDGSTAETDNPLGTPFYLYGTYKINEELTAGLAVYTPFGSSVVWGDDWQGRYLIQDISLSAIFIQPTFSIQASEKLAVGLGFVYATGNVEINRALPYQSNSGADSYANLSGGADGYGFNFGAHFQATDELSFGLTYRSGVNMELEDGDAEFKSPLPASSLPPTNTFSATLPLPSTATFGVAYQLNDKVLISAEYSNVNWSVYESLDFDFENNTDAFEDSENPRRYEASSIFRLGFQYMVNESLTARLGGYYDESPIQDEFFNPETPNSDNIGITAGLSYTLNDKLAIDASFIYIDGQERESYYSGNNLNRTNGDNFGGKYKSRSFIPGIGIRYNF
ncbi:MAG: outer membrane protein transport protein [Vicingaceae bacterium]